MRTELEPRNPIRVLIADDQVLFAESLSYVLRGISDTIQVVGIAPDGDAARRLALTLRPDIVLMDVRMPNLDGVAATRLIHEEDPAIRIVMLTTFDDDEYVHSAIAYGAVENLLGQGAWDDRDLLIIDMPAGSDDVVGAAVEHVPVDGAVFVTTPFDASIDDTRRTVELFDKRGVTPIAGVVNMNSIECDCCGGQTVLFDDAVDLDVPVVHELPFDRTLQRNPGGRREYDAFGGLAETVGKFVDEVLDAVPDDALDLRGLPLESQVRQLSDELATATVERHVRAVVDDPASVAALLREDAAGILASIDRRPLGTTGSMLELARD